MFVIVRVARTAEQASVIAVDPRDGASASRGGAFFPVAATGLVGSGCSTSTRSRR